MKLTEADGRREVSHLRGQWARGLGHSRKSMRILRYRLLDMQVLHPITEDKEMLTTIRLPNRGQKRSIDNQRRVQIDANMELSTGIVYCELWGVVWSI